jgi:hypothetical protein
MLVKFNSRGKGGGSGPIDYLLGKDRNRDKAHVLRGDADQTKQLIDSLSFARNYTSGTLSFSEENIPEHRKQEIMGEYQKMLLAGLDCDQYDVLWVEHRDKDRLELNFLIPNVELGTGKRLQPYYDAVDRDRVNAWQQTVNDRYGFTDPHDPQNKRFAVTAQDLPNDRKKAVEVITNSLVNLVDRGAIKNRDDVIQELTASGFEIARKTKTAISIKDPQGGKNIRLKGALYENDFKFSSGIRETIERANKEYQEQRKQRLSAARHTLNQTYKAKCKYNTERYPRTKQAEPKGNTASNIQSLASVSNGNNLGRSISGGRTVHTTEIKHPTIKTVVENNVRHKSRISTCLEALVQAVRTAVRRSTQTSKCISGANNFTHQLRNRQQRPNIIARRKDSTRTQENDNRNERGIRMR